MNRSTLRWLVLLAVLVLAAAACGDGGDGDGDAVGGEDTGTDEVEGDGDGGEVSGEVTILHAFTGEADTAGFNAILDAFREANPDIEVTEEGSNDFESLARTRIGSGTPPDIMLHPQPGLLEDFISQGVVQPLDYLDPAALEEDMVGGLVELGTFDGTLYAIPLRLSLKSLVWYNKPVFDEQGYAVPETWDELMQLTQTIADDTELAPWCIGIESGDATGWVATDWVEDILLRTIGPEQYDAWVAGDLDFASPEVQGAIDEHMAPIWTTDEFVNGGRANIAREAFGTAVLGILGGADGECVLHRQATFIEGFIEENNPDAEFGTDYDFFYLPSIDEEFGDPALGAGDFAAQYTDNEAAREFMRFLATAESGEGWAALGGYLSPFATFDPSVYPTDTSRQAGELLAQATSFRFDGSDLMPGEVGASSQEGSFWLEMTQWVTGEQELEESLQSIDSLYDQIAGG